MIGKINTGRSFYHAISYCMQDKREYSHTQKLTLSKEEGVQHLGRAEVLYYHLCSGERKELIEDFSRVAHLSSRTEKPVLHLSLKLAPGERLEKDKWVQIAQDFAADFKLENNQYLAILHKDSTEEHIHIVANRVGFDGKAAGTGNNYRQVAAFARKMELKHQLVQVLSPQVFLTEKQRLTNGKTQRVDRRKEYIKEVLQEQLLKAKDMEDFTKKMGQAGIRVEKGRGIAFIDDKNVRVKGSSLGYPLKQIERILAHLPAHRLLLQQRLQTQQERQRMAAGNKELPGKAPGQKPDLWEEYWRKARPAQPVRSEEKEGYSLKNLSSETLLDMLTRIERGEPLPFELSPQEEQRKRRQRQQQHDRGL